MSEIIDWVNSWSLGGKLSILWIIPVIALVVLSAMRLVKNSHVIIAKTKFGGAFFGGAIIAVITSIPELLTEITQGFAGNPAAGISDDLGSNAFSAFLIAIIALFWIKKKKFLNNLDRWTKISVWISFSLSVLMTILLYINRDIVIGTIGVFAIGIWPVLFFVVFVIVLIFEWKFGSTDYVDNINVDESIPVKKAIWHFIAWAFVIAILSVMLNIFSNSLQAGYGLSSRSTGGILLSVVTSLPEVLVFYLLMKGGQPIAGMAAIMGSHIFNMALVFFGDLSDFRRPSFADPDVHHVWPLGLLTATLMLLLGIHTLFGSRIKKSWQYSIIPALMTSVYIGGWVILLIL